MACVIAFRRQPLGATHFSPPVTVLKPLRGDDGYLYENLRSFCVQDYPTYEVIFGVQDGRDPAVAVVGRLMRELPDVALRLVVDERRVGINPEINNVANIFRFCKQDGLIQSTIEQRGPTRFLRSLV